MNKCPECKRQAKPFRHNDRRKLTHTHDCRVFWDKKYEEDSQLLHAADGPPELQKLLNKMWKA